MLVHLHYIVTFTTPTSTMAFGGPTAPTAFDCDSDTSTVGFRWQKWLDRFENYLVAVNINNAPRSKALLLHLAGERVYDIYEAICEPADDFAAVKQKLTDHFKPMKDTALMIFHFREAAQKPGETIDQFLARLRGLARHCEFQDTDAEIRAQIVQKTSDKSLCREILKHPAWSLADVLTEARSREAAEHRALDIEERCSSTPAAVNQVSVKRKDYSDKPQNFSKPAPASRHRSKSKIQDPRSKTTVAKALAKNPNSKV